MIGPRRGAQWCVLAGAALLAASCGGRSDRVKELEERVQRLEARLAKLPADDAVLGAAGEEELAQRLASGDLVTRYRAARELAHREDVGHAALVEQLASDDPHRRGAAAAALATSAVEEDAPAIVSALPTTQQEGPRALLVTALGRAGGPEAAEPVIAALEDPARRVRVAAIAAARRLALPNATGALLRIAISDDLLAPMAADALLTLDEAGSFPFIVVAWEGMSPRERQRVVTLLARRRSQTTTDFLADQLGDADPRVALAAALALAQRGETAGLALARNRLSSDDPAIASIARQVLDAAEPEQ